MNSFSISEALTALSKGTLSSVELVTNCLQQIAQHKKLNALISLVDAGHALAQAQEADSLRAAGKGSIFTGIPIVHKDNFCTIGLRTTCGSRMLANFVPPYEATIVHKLTQAGAITLGKTNMDEFAMGSTGETSYFGSTLNPWHQQYSPGGSSSGSASAVAAGLALAATGSDTGGSIRQPAAFCGVSGLKPTYGRVSRYGLIAYASSFDQAGVIAKSAEDLALLLKTIAGVDDKDATSLCYPVPDYPSLLNQSLRGVRIALPRAFFQETIATPEVRQAIDAAVHVFVDAGAQIIEVELKYLHLWVPCYYLIACAEASTNLARYDGLRFGLQVQDTETVHDMVMHSRSLGFGSEVKRRILAGTHALTAQNFSASYLQALKIRRLIQQELLAIFTQADLLIGPTTPTPAPRLGLAMSNNSTTYDSDIFTVGANLAGIPAISIPVGFHRQLPLGMQIMASHFAEAKLLNAAHQYQKMTDWHKYAPPQKEKKI